MNKLLLVIPFCSKDHVNAAQLLRWMAELQPEGYKPHSCLIAADNIVPDPVKKEIFQLAKPQFAYTDLLRIPVPNDRQNWIAGSNFMWEQTARTIADCVKLPWFWCEPDCIPLKAGWLDALAEAYSTCPRRFMGAHIQAVNQPNMPPLHMAGCAVYDSKAYEGLKPYVQQTSQAFDIAASQYTVMRSVNTPLIQHFWGKPDLAPTFRETKGNGDPENTVPMGFIRPDAVLWHRAKDGTLIDCLRRRMTTPKPEPAWVADFDKMTASFPAIGTPTQVVGVEVPERKIEFPKPPGNNPEPHMITPSEPVKRGPGRPRKNPEPVHS